MLKLLRCITTTRLIHSTMTEDFSGSTQGDSKRAKFKKTEGTITSRQKKHQSVPGKFQTSHLEKPKWATWSKNSTHQFTKAIFCRTHNRHWNSGPELQGNIDSDLTAGTSYYCGVPNVFCNSKKKKCLCPAQGVKFDYLREVGIALYATGKSTIVMTTIGP